MSKKQQLKQSIYVMLEHNRDGAYETQRIRRKALFQMADDLHKAGY
ncbi:MAG: hypothetical protein ACFFD6_11610, partial [Candidatus Thorarchaeota archaeon]